MNVVILSNSYGEDRSGALIAKELRKLDGKIRIRAFPLISFGEEYKKRNIKVVGGHPPPPSGGFLLKSVKNFLADITKVFFLPFSYVDRLRIFKDKTHILIVVGDFSLLLLGYISLRKEAYFLEQCKSNYIHPHLPFERVFISKIAKKVFTHDKITCDDLKDKGIDAKFVGNPMMDDLSEEKKYFSPEEKPLIGLLPGSRKEAYNNMKKIVKIVKELASMDQNLHFAVALSETIDKEKIITVISDLRNNIDVCYGSFVDIVKKSRLVISLGGTASEQSLYLETPVVSFPGSGAQNTRRRLNGQKKLLGDAFILLDCKPEKIAEKILELIYNKKLLKKLKEKGKKRAGEYGGAKKIAQYIYSEEVKIKKSSRESRRQKAESPLTLKNRNIKKMKKKIEAAVILPTYNRLSVLKKCLEAFSNQTTKNFEIILIDDCSDDGTKKYIENCDFKNLRYIRLEKRSGPYYARNLGVKKAKGEIIIFVDSDVIVFPDFVEDHIKIHKRNETIVVQGMVKHIKNLKKVNMNRFYLPNALCLRTFITQNASIRRKYLISVGGFENFGPKMGYKDVDMGLKLMDLGLSWKHGIRKCKAFHIDGDITKESLMEIFAKWTTQGASACYFVGKWGERGEKYARTRKALFFSKLFCTHRWAERENMPGLVVYSRKHFIIAYWILKGFIRYHYRSKGIKEVKISEGISDCSEL